MKLSTSLVLVVAAVAVFGVAAICVVGKRNQDRFALFNAAQVGELEKVKLLISRGAPVNQKAAAVFGFTPLIGAIYHDCTNTAYYLVEAGADVNLGDRDGVTPLMWATIGGDREVSLVKYLIAHGARLEARDKKGMTVFAYAQSEPPKPQLIEALETAKREQDRKAGSNSDTVTNGGAQRP